MLRISAAIILDCLYPRYCLICGRHLLGEAAPGDHICPACVPDLDFSADKSCSNCSRPLISEHRMCMRCRSREYAFFRNISLYSYTGRIKVLLHRYKFEGYRSLSRLFADKASKILVDEFPGQPIVPVPSRRKGKKEKGWDHVELITRKLERFYGYRVLHLLKRRGGRTQKSLSYDERLLNMKGTVQPAGKFRSCPKRVVLLDDVFTTGATAHECSLVLKEIGVKQVNVLTLALD